MNPLATLLAPGAWLSEFQYVGVGRRRVRKEYTWQGGAWVQTNEVRYVNTRPNNLKCVGLLLLLLSVQQLSAYYDPGVQRWINRDPIQEEGGINLYAALDNSPLARLDQFGLQCNGGGSVPGVTIGAPKETVRLAVELAKDAGEIAPTRVPVVPLLPSGQEPEQTTPPPDLDDCIDVCKDQRAKNRLDAKGYEECVRKCAKVFPPKHPKYKAPKGGPKKTQKGWLDKFGREWQPETHGRERAHYDIQLPNGTHDKCPIIQ